MNRRGFTILELALASSVAVIVIAASLILFQTVDRTDRRLAGKLDRVAEVERTRRAFQNAFASIATSERPRPRQSNVSGAEGAAGSGSKVPADSKLKSGAETEAPTGDSVAPPPPPRVLLAPDTGSTSDPLASAMGVQRLELVLSNSPVPVIKREGAEQARMAMAEAAGDERRVNPTEEGGARAIRGEFSLRPQLDAPAKDVKAEYLDRQLLELWWTPLPPAQDDPSAEPLPLALAAGYPVKLCSDVARCSWRMYREGQWAEQHAAVWRDDLPAYAEVQMEFGNGASYKWLMEIDYTVMAEVTSSELDSDAAKSAGGSRDARTGKTGSSPAGSTRNGTPIHTNGTRIKGASR